MEGPESGLAKAHQWARGVLRRRVIILSAVLSGAYLLTWLVLRETAEYHRRSDFFSNSAREWVQVGAWRFGVDGFDRFMGTVFHPLALVTLGAPALFALAVLCLGGTLLLLGVLAAWREGEIARLQAVEDDKVDLERRRIEVEKDRPVLIAMGVAEGRPPAGIRLLVYCDQCRTRFDSNAGKCPNCGKSPGRAQ